MGIVLDIVEEVAKFIAWLIFEIVMVATGEFALWAITAGYRKPRWDMYVTERASRYVVFTEASCWVGIATWMLAIVVIRQLVSGSGNLA